jgi:hypothetical protein
MLTELPMLILVERCRLTLHDRWNETFRPIEANG